jgi:thiopeptide-type bacteriocin biosynthesis protein
MSSPDLNAAESPDEAPMDLPCLEQAVRAVLAGTPIPAAAAAAGLTPAALTDAVHEYRSAGRAALHDHLRDSRWHQVDITFPDWASAERAASSTLLPAFKDAQDAGLVSSWWYVRKNPCWRLRLHPTTHTSSADLRQWSHGMLTNLIEAHLIAGWSPGHYQPESYAFGGAMDIAHHLFHADSANFLTYLNQYRHSGDEPIGRRELSILLCSALLRAAKQEWHEQGDVWYRVTHLRPAPPQNENARIRTISSRLRALLTLDSGVVCTAAGRLAFANAWFTTMAAAGHALYDRAEAGMLRRGLRDVLAHNVLFHWNRLGLSLADQTVLANSAVHAVMALPNHETHPHQALGKASGAPPSA